MVGQLPPQDDSLLRADGLHPVQQLPAQAGHILLGIIGAHLPYLHQGAVLQVAGQADHPVDALPQHRQLFPLKLSGVLLQTVGCRQHDGQLLIDLPRQKQILFRVEPPVVAGDGVYRKQQDQDALRILPGLGPGRKPLAPDLAAELPAPPLQTIGYQAGRHRVLQKIIQISACQVLINHIFKRAGGIQHPPRGCADEIRLHGHRRVLKGGQAVFMLLFVHNWGCPFPRKTSNFSF